MIDNYMETYMGIHFYPLHLTIDSINIKDIAHALSNICRFNGHSSEFFSVAQHSILVSDHVSMKNKMWALLHDASEAYICDIPSPLKKSDYFKEYRNIEKNIMDVICDKFGMDHKEPEEVKKYDLLALRTEAEQLGFVVESWKTYDLKPLDVKIRCWSADKAEEVFLNTFYELY